MRQKKEDAEEEREDYQSCSHKSNSSRLSFLYLACACSKLGLITEKQETSSLSRTWSKASIVNVVGEGC